MAWNLTEAQEHLQAWLEADKDVATGQSYKMGDQTLTRADVSAIRKQIQFWSNEVNRLSAGRPQGARRFRAVPID